MRTLTLAALARLSPVAVTAFAVASPPARAADDPDPYTIGVVETVSHDSNVFRAPSGPAVAADWISTTGLIGSVDQPIGRERIKAALEFDYDKFKRQTQLDSAAHSVSLEGDWATVGDLYGELGYVNSSQLYRYSIDSTPITEKNTQDIQQGFARFHLGGPTRLTLNAVFNAMDRKYSADPYKPRNLRRWDGSIGATYKSSPDLALSLSYRHTHGEYPLYTSTDADDFSRNDFILGVVYAASGASTFRLNASAAHETHTVITARSSHTWAADGAWIWTPTGKTRLTIDFLRDDDAGTTDTPFFNGVIGSSDARRRTAVRAAVDYELTAKLQAQLTGSFAKRDLDDAFAEVPALNARGGDHLTTVGAGLTWLPTRNSRLGCNFSRESRTVQGAPLAVTYPYDANVISCSGQISFN